MKYYGEIQNSMRAVTITSSSGLRDCERSMRFMIMKWVRGLSKLNLVCLTS